MALPSSSVVELLTPSGIRLLEVPPPVVSEGHARVRDVRWEEFAAGNPGLFDGPVVVCAGARAESGGVLVLRWARETYRHFALWWVPGAAPWAGVFVTVTQPAADATVLVGRMASTTAGPLAVAGRVGGATAVW